MNRVSPASLTALMQKLGAALPASRPTRFWWPFWWPFSGHSGHSLPRSPRQALWIALSCSLALHGAAVALRFRLPAPDFSKAASSLDVVLVNSKSRSRPHKADALAQANLDGGGNTDAPQRARTPLPPAPRSTQDLQFRQAEKQVAQLEQRAQKLLTQLQPSASMQSSPVQSAPQTRQQDTPRGAELAQRSLDLARLEGRIAQQWNEYQQRPRRKFIGARTEEFRFAQYVEDWRQKIERIGNLNYPDAARQQKIYGSLRVTVSIRADGSMESAEINWPSGHKILDAAVLRILQLAAPFAPFPPELRRDTDILSITRTWTFTRSDQLTGE